MSRGVLGVAVAGTLLLVAACILDALSAPPARALDHDRIDAYVEDQLEANRLPGLALAITRGDEVRYLRGYGEASDGAPITPDTSFRIASLSKSFTATAVLQLVDDGRVELDVPVRTYLSDFRVDARITVRQLLNQTSGLADTGFPEATLPQPDSLAERVDDLRDAEPIAPPGKEFHYFNPNYDVLARLVEVVSGRSYESYLHNKVLDPLGMSHTTLAQHGEAPPGLVDGHVVVGGFAISRPESRGFLGGNGALVSNGRDLSRWLVAQDGHEPSVVSPRALALMHAPPPEPAATTYGMGWFDGGKTLWHNGILSTYYAEQMLLPKHHYGIAVLVNANNGLVPLHSIATGIADLLRNEPARGPAMSGGAIELGLGIATLVTIGVRGYELARVRRWARVGRHRTWWWLVPGTVWQVLPLAVLAWMPSIVAAFAGRVFTRTQLFWSMPSVHLWFGIAALTGIGLVVARLVALRHTVDVHNDGR